MLLGRHYRGCLLLAGESAQLPPPAWRTRILIDSMESDFMTLDRLPNSTRRASYRLMIPGLCVLLSSMMQPAAANPVFTDGFETVELACNDPLIAPEGWPLYRRPWVDVWSSPDGSPVAIYPESVGFPVPVGAIKYTLTVVSFTPTANQTVDITWDYVQANLNQGYYPRPALSMFFAISPCPGDARAPDNFSADPFLHDRCRGIASIASLFFSTRKNGSPNDNICRLEAGQPYFMTIAPIDPSNGLQPREHTCDNSAPGTENGCEVQATHRGY